MAQLYKFLQSGRPYPESRQLLQGKVYKDMSNNLGNKNNVSTSLDAFYQLAHSLKSTSKSSLVALLSRDDCLLFWDAFWIAIDSLLAVRGFSMRSI